MEFKRLMSIQSFIGKQFTGNLSPFNHWLKGKVISIKEKSVELEFAVRNDNFEILSII